MPRCVVGLDLATKTGWCVDDGVSPIAGTYSLKSTINEDDDTKRDAERLSGFYTWLRAFLLEHKPILVAIEAPLMASPSRDFHEERVDDSGRRVRVTVRKAQENPRTKLLAFGLRAIAIAVCGLLNIPVVEVPIGTWRSAFFGKGNSRAPKSAENGRAWQKTRAKAQAELLGVKVNSADAAEACGIAFWARGQAMVGSQKRPDQLV